MHDAQRIAECKSSRRQLGRLLPQILKQSVASADMPPASGLVSQSNCFLHEQRKLRLAYRAAHPSYRPQLCLGSHLILSNAGIWLAPRACGDLILLKLTMAKGLRQQPNLLSLSRRLQIPGRIFGCHVHLEIHRTVERGIL